MQQNEIHADRDGRQHCIVTKICWGGVRTREHQQIRIHQSAHCHLRQTSFGEESCEQFLLRKTRELGRTSNASSGVRRADGVKPE